MSSPSPRPGAPPKYEAVSIAPAMQAFLMDELGSAIYLGPDGAAMDPATLTERDLILASVILTDQRPAPNGEVFFSLWRSKPLADSADFEFWFEGASDADLSAVKALEVILEGNCREFPIEHTSANLIRAAFHLPQREVWNAPTRRASSPFTLRLMT